MFAVQNKYDGQYLTARGFAGSGPAWDHEDEAATFESREEAEEHARTCEVQGSVRVVEIDA